MAATPLVSDVLSALSSIDAHKAMGIDNIGPMLLTVGVKKSSPVRSVQRAPVLKNPGGERELNGNWTGDERNGPFRTNSRLILISPLPFSGTGEYTHARMSRVLFLSRVLLLKAQQEQTSKLRIFLIKLSHSSSYENTFAFQHFSDRRRAITFGLKERAILFAYSG